MNETFLKDAFSFHQTIFKDLNNRSWDLGDVAIIKSKIEFVYKICYGDKWNPNVEKIMSAVKIKFFDVSKVDSENNRWFGCSFIYSRLEKTGESWVSVLLRTKTHDGSEILLDVDCRQYTTFSDFLENNKYPACFMTFPEKGVYTTTKDFPLINCAWSNSSGMLYYLKKVFDVGSLVGSIVSTGFLLRNPVGIALLAAQAGFYSSSVYGIARGVETLMDAQNHNGGFCNNTAVLAAADIVLTTGSILTLGVSQAIKTILSRSGSVILDGSLIYKVVIALDRSFKYLSISGAGIYLLLLVEKFTEGTLTLHDLANFGQYILFAFNCYVSFNLLKKLLSDLASYDITDLSKFLINREHMTVEHVVRYVNMIDYNNLVNRLFPRDTKLYKELAPIGKNINEISNLINDYKSGKMATGSFVSSMVDTTCNLYKNVIYSLENTEGEISRMLNSNGWKNVCKWLEENKKEYFCNTYSKKIEMLNNLKNTTINCTQELQFENKQQLFLEFMLTLLCRHEVEDNGEAMKKIEFYSQIFKKEFFEIIESAMFTKFAENACTVYNERKAACPGKVGMACPEEIGSLLEYCFSQVFDKMHNNLDLYNELYHQHSETNPEEDNDTPRSLIYVFNRQVTTDNEFFIYLDIVNSLTNLCVDPENAIFRTYSNNISSIVLIRDEKFLIFKSEKEEGFLKGIMVCIN